MAQVVAIQSECVMADEDAELCVLEAFQLLSDPSSSSSSSSSSDLIAPPSPILVWDLDETLMHSVQADSLLPYQFAKYMRLVKQDEQKPFLEREYFYVEHNEHSQIKHFVKLRPFLRDTLYRFQQEYGREIIFSAGNPEYVENIVKLIYDSDPRLKQPLLVLSWLNCSVVERNEKQEVQDYIKPLWSIVEHYPHFNFALENFILIDNRVENARYTPLQCIKVDDYKPTLENNFSPNDSFLRDVIPNQVKAVHNSEHYRYRVKASNLFYLNQQHKRYPTVFEEYLANLRT